MFRGFEFCAYPRVDVCLGYYSVLNHCKFNILAMRILCPFAHIHCIGLEYNLIWQISDLDTAIYWLDMHIDSAMLCKSYTCTYHLCQLQQSLPVKQLQLVLYIHVLGIDSLAYTVWGKKRLVRLEDATLACGTATLAATADPREVAANVVEDTIALFAHIGMTALPVHLPYHQVQS